MRREENNALCRLAILFVFASLIACRPHQPEPQPPVPQWRTLAPQAFAPTEEPEPPVFEEPLVVPMGPAPVLTVSASVHPWSSMGLEPGDHVLELVGRPIDNPLQARVAIFEVGYLESVWATAIRGGETLDVSWTQTPDLSEGVDCANLGGWMASCDVASWVVDELVAELSSPDQLQVQLTVASTSWGARALSFEHIPTDSGFTLFGFSEGDLIVAMNQVSVVSVEQLLAAMQTASGRVLVEFRRNDRIRLVSMRIAE